MTDFPSTHKDLLDAQVASLATVGADGIPAASIVWFLHDEGELRISLNDARLKTRHLMKRPKASLMIFDPQNAFRYLEVRGNVEIEPDDDYEFAGRVGAKYGGADVRSHDGPGEKRVKVTLVPTKVYAVDMSA